MGLVSRTRDLLGNLDDDTLQLLQPEMQELVGTLQQRVTIAMSLPMSAPSPDEVDKFERRYSEQIPRLKAILKDIKLKLDPKAASKS